MLATLSFAFKYPNLGLLSIVATFAFLPFATGYMTLVIIFALNQMITTLFGRTYSFLGKYSKQISTFIIVFGVGSALIAIYIYSFWAGLSATGGIVIAIVFKRGYQNATLVRDKIDMALRNFKEVLKRN